MIIVAGSKCVAQNACEYLHIRRDCTLIDHLCRLLSVPPVVKSAKEDVCLNMAEKCIEIFLDHAFFHSSSHTWKALDAVTSGGM